MTRGTAAALVLAMLTMANCKGKPPEDPASSAISSESEVRAGFDEVLATIETCDPARFLDVHTQKAQGAMEALDKVVVLAAIGLDPAADHPGARWTCTLARLAGFRKADVHVEKVAVNPKIGTARVIFTMRDREFGFPMARQFGKWRSPFPGFVFLASEYRDWQKAIEKALPDPARWPDLASDLGRAITLLEPFQPDWGEFPDLAPKVE
jgi:hypothetical protein